MQGLFDEIVEIAPWRDQKNIFDLIWKGMKGGWNMLKQAWQVSN